MFDISGDESGQGQAAAGEADGGAAAAGEPGPGWSTADLAAAAGKVRGMPVAGSQAEHITRIRLLEELKAVCAAVQARETAALYAARRDAEEARGIPAAHRCRGLASEVALARRDSPARGSRHVGLAIALVREMPHTMDALSAGAISEWRAVLVAKETAWLPVEGRRHVDERLAPRLDSAGDRALAAEARALAQAYDPAEAVRHLARAYNERCVSIRPAPDTMVYLTALLPMVQGVATYAALDRAAASAVATGQAGERGRGQVMADVLVERLTGQEKAEAVPVEVHLVMSDAALFGDAGGPFPAGAGQSRTGTGSIPAGTGPAGVGAGSSTPAGVGDVPTGAGPFHAGAVDDPALGDADHGEGISDGDSGSPPMDLAETPAWLVGHGPLPAATARDLLDPAHDGPSGQARVWIRRLYTDPETGQLVAVDSKRRLFDGLLRRMVILRDDTCRTPWCDAPIRHADHGTPHHAGGPTNYSNGSGLCQRCNLTKEADRWSHEASPDRLDVVTPTGHVYSATTRPLLPGRTRPSANHSPRPAQPHQPPRRHQPPRPPTSTITPPPTHTTATHTTPTHKPATQPPTRDSDESPTSCC